MESSYFEYWVCPSGFKEEIEAFLMDRFFNGIEEQDECLILRSEEELEPILKELQEYVKSLEQLFNTQIPLEIKKEKKLNKDWIESYKNSITPVEVGEFYIFPSWYSPKEGKINLKIDPALAFGSGHHETTQSCLEAISKYVKPKTKALDVGCGSGILALAMAKKGAIVDICDTDELAIKESIKNAQLNEVEFNKSWVGSAGMALEKYDIVTANIVADVLLMIANDLKKRLKDNAYLVLSGILSKDRQRVLEKFDLPLVEEILKNEWTTLILKNRGEDGREETTSKR